jgi:hypothetical protein
MKQQLYTSQSFGDVINHLINGCIAWRADWAPSEFIFRQIPSTVPNEFIPKMTSLPQMVKDAIVAGGGSISYRNQLAIRREGDIVEGWTPNAFEIFANDWIVVAGEETNANEMVSRQHVYEEFKKLFDMFEIAADDAMSYGPSEVDVDYIAMIESARQVLDRLAIHPEWKKEESMVAGETVGVASPTE